MKKHRNKTWFKLFSKCLPAIISCIIISFIFPLALQHSANSYQKNTALTQLIINNGFIPLREKYAHCQGYALSYLNNLSSIHDQLQKLNELILSQQYIKQSANNTLALQKQITLLSQIDNKTNLYNKILKINICRSEVLGIISNMSMLLKTDKEIEDLENRDLTYKNQLHPTPSFAYDDLLSNDNLITQFIQTASTGSKPSKEIISKALKQITTDKQINSTLNQETITSIMAWDDFYKSTTFTLTQRFSMQDL